MRKTNKNEFIKKSVDQKNSVFFLFIQFILNKIIALLYIGKCLKSSQNIY